MNSQFSRIETSGNGSRPLTSSRSQLSPTRSTFPLAGGQPRSNTTKRPPPSTLGPTIPREASTASQIGFSYATVIEPTPGSGTDLPISPPAHGRSTYDDKPMPMSSEPKDNDQHSSERQGADRSSLDIPPLWKSMPETILKEDEHHKQLPLDPTEDYLIQLLVQQSVIDAKDFDVLTLEQVEELKKVCDKKTRGQIST